MIPTSTIFGLTPEEMGQLRSEGLKIGDKNPKVEGVEVSGASPFKVMRVLGKLGWSTDGEPVETTVTEGKQSWMWTLTRDIKK